MTKDKKKQVEKIVMGLCPPSVFRFLSPLPSFRFSSTLNSTSLIPRRVINNNIHVFAVHTDMRMESNSHHRRTLHNNYTNVFPPYGSRVTTGNSSDSTNDLDKAAQSGSLDGAKMAVSRDRRLLMLQNAEGNLPLHTAIKLGYTELALYLVEEYPHGSYVLNKEGSSPLYLAVKGEHLDVVCSIFNMPTKELDPRLLFNELKQGKSLVHAAIQTDNKEMLKRIMKHEAKLLETRDGEGRTPLSFAAYKGNIDIVAYLLKMFPNSKYMYNKDKSYPIHTATVTGQIEILHHFLQCSAESLKLQDCFGRTILHIAAKQQRVEVVSYLLEHLPKDTIHTLLCTKDENEDTPIKLANNQIADHILAASNIN